MTAYELLERLEAAGHGSAPPVVYRALDFLVANGFAHRIEGLGAFAACTHAGRARHGAGFLVCRVCRPVAETELPAAARAGGRGGGGGLRGRAAGGRGRGALRALPGGRGVSVLIEAQGLGVGFGGQPVLSDVTLTLRAGRDRHGGRAERLGQEHAPAAADRRRAAGPRAGGAGAGAEDRLRAAEARGRPHAAADRRRVSSARRRRAGGAGRGARACRDRRARGAAAGGAVGRAVPAGDAGAGGAAAAGPPGARRGDAGARPGRRGALLPADRGAAERARLRRADGQPRPARGDGGLGPGDLPERPRLLRGDADRGVGGAGVSRRCSASGRRGRWRSIVTTTTTSMARDRTGGHHHSHEHQHDEGAG